MNSAFNIHTLNGLRNQSRSDLAQNLINSSPWELAEQNMFKMSAPNESDLYRSAILGGLQESNRFAQQIAAEKQWEFAQNSAREGMEFNAYQAELNRQFNLSAAREAMEFDANQAAIWRDWYENMANTSYQRAVADMKDAGLNPALAYMQGGAASTMGATAGGHAASGTAAQGFAASGNKADVDTTTTKDLMSMFVNAALDFYKTSVSAIADIIPL